MGVSCGLARYFIVFPALGLAAAVLPRRTARAARAVRRYKVSESEVWQRNAARALGRPRARDPVQLAGLRVHDRASDRDDLLLARHAGHVPDVPASAMALHTEQRRGALRVLDVGALVGGVRRACCRTGSAGGARWCSRSRCGVLVIPAVGARPNVVLLVAGAFLIQACVQGAWA